MAELALCGGAPVRPQGYPAWPVHDERDAQAVAEVVRSGRWGGFPEPGPLAASFAERFAAYQGSRHGVVMANGTVTMEVALKALGIGWGDEVIVPALTFAATPYAAMAAGALPVFCDVLAVGVGATGGPGRSASSAPSAISPPSCSPPARAAACSPTTPGWPGGPIR